MTEYKMIGGKPYRLVDIASVPPHVPIDTSIDAIYQGPAFVPCSLSEYNRFHKPSNSLKKCPSPSTRRQG